MAEEAAIALFDDSGLSEDDSNDEGDDIYGYLGKPVLSHADLIPSYEPTDNRLDEMDDRLDETAEYGSLYDEQDEATDEDQDSASDDGSRDSIGTNDSSGNEQDMEQASDGDEMIRIVSTPTRSTASSKEDTIRDVVSRTDLNKQV